MHPSYVLGMYTGCLCVRARVSYLLCYMSVLFISVLSTHQPGAWLDSLGTDVNKLCLRKSQTQNVCEHGCNQSHMSLLVFHPAMFSPRNSGEIHVSLLYSEENLMIKNALLQLFYFCELKGSSQNGSYISNTLLH